MGELLNNWIVGHSGDRIKGACLEHPEKDGQIDLVQTPSELGWKTTDSERILWVVPADESQEAAAALVPVPQVQPAEDSRKRARVAPAKAANPAPAKAANPTGSVPTGD